MRRLSLIACIIVMTMIMGSATVLGASALKITDSYPEDNQKNTTTENMSVKLHFNNAVGADKYRKINEKAFKIVDSKDKALPIIVCYNPKNDKEVLVLVDMRKVAEQEKKTKTRMVQDKHNYTLKIDKSFTDNNGNQLGKNDKITFQTINQAWNTKVYMIMMAVMMVGMFGFTAYEAKKHRAQENQTEDKAEPFNPYKEAKRTGKPLEEIIAKHEKEMAKKKAQEAKRKPKEIEPVIEEDELPYGHYKVKAVRTVASGGSSYITGRKAAAEARKAEEERLAKRRQANKKRKK